MKSQKIISEQLHCPVCSTIIPAGQTKCPNPNCPTNKPLRGKLRIKTINKRIKTTQHH
jgi:predicted nucleic acid-binding Zn ribbon protein